MFLAPENSTGSGQPPATPSLTAPQSLTTSDFNSGSSSCMRQVSTLTPPPVPLHSSHSVLHRSHHLISHPSASNVIWSKLSNLQRHSALQMAPRELYSTLFLPGGRNNPRQLLCSSPGFYCCCSKMTKPTGKVWFSHCTATVSILTSQPGHAVGFGRWSVNSEGFSGKYFFVFRFLYQVSDFSHEPVQESWQHSGATDDNQVLCQLLPGVYGTLMQTGIKKKTNTLTEVTWRSSHRSVRNSVSLSLRFSCCLSPAV